MEFGGTSVVNRVKFNNFAGFEYQGRYGPLRQAQFSISNQVLPLAIVAFEAKTPAARKLAIMQYYLVIRGSP